MQDMTGPKKKPWERTWGQDGPIMGPPPKPETPPAPPSGYRPGANGNLEIIPGGPSDPYRPGGAYDPNKPQSAEGDGKPTEGERADAAFLRRMLLADQQYTGSDAGPRSGVSAAAKALLPEGVMNRADSETRQRYDRAVEDFIAASLRVESGAAIGPDEYTRQYRIFFPGTNQDGEEINADFIAARRNAIEGMIDSAGRAVDPELQEMIDQWRGRGQVRDGEQSDKTTVNTMASSGEQLEIADGDSKTVHDDRLTGVNDAVNQLLANGAADGEILGFLKEKGMDTGTLVAAKNWLNEVRDHQRQFPDFKGPYNVDLERMDRPNEWFNKVAASGPGAAGIAYFDTATGGHLDNVVGAMGGDAELANYGMSLSREANPGWSTIGDVAAGATLGVGMGRLAPATLSNGWAAAAGDAALGAYISSGQGGTQIADPKQMLYGAGIGTTVGGVTRGMIKGLGNTVSPTGGKMKPLFDEGVRPTVGQRMAASENGVVRQMGRLEEIYGKLPIVGGIQRGARNAAIDEMQTGAFNQALREIGAKLPADRAVGKGAHQFAQNAFDAAYDKARLGMQFVPDGQFAQEFGDALRLGSEITNSDSRNAFIKIARDFGNAVRAGGNSLDGQGFKRLVGRISRKAASTRRNVNGDMELVEALEALRTSIDNGARRTVIANGDDAAAAALDAADAGYAKLVVIENAARMRGGEAGTFTGTQLDSAVQRTDMSRRSKAYLRGEANMQEYAEAAKNLGNFVSDSGSPEQLMALGGAGMAATAMPKAMGVPWMASTLATAPGMRQGLGAVMRPRQSQKLISLGDHIKNRARLLGSVAGTQAALPSE